MQKLVILVVGFLVTFTAYAQEYKNTIVLNKSVSFLPAEITYNVSFTISLDFIKDGEEEIELLKEIYFRNLKEAGIDISKIREEHLGYLRMGYRKEGALYTFKTNSKEKVLQFYAAKSLGVDGMTVTVSSYPSPREISELTDKAIANSKDEARLIAEKSGRQLGKIISIESNNNWDVPKYSVYNNEFFYTLKVAYELL